MIRIKDAGGLRMKKKGNLVKASISVNRKAWKESKSILMEIGLSRSTFISITLAQLVRENKSPLSPQERMDDVVGTLFELSRKGRKKKTV
jgi:antitoxin component of RelBE/YafQ-DinJ toxin-antitoxin module